MKWARITSDEHAATREQFGQILEPRGLRREFGSSRCRRHDLGSEPAIVPAWAPGHDGPDSGSGEDPACEFPEGRDWIAFVRCAIAATRVERHRTIAALLRSLHAELQFVVGSPNRQKTDERCISVVPAHLDPRQ